MGLILSGLLFFGCGGGSSPAPDKLEITSNTQPTASSQNITVDEDTDILVTLTATDIDDNNLTYHVSIQPSHGKLSGTTPNLTYTPDANYTGSDSFGFYVNDGTVNSAPATVNIVVKMYKILTYREDSDGDGKADVIKTYTWAEF